MPLQFEELPPPSKQYSWKWTAEVDELRSHPGQWAKVTTKPNGSTARNMATNIKQGLLRAFQPPKSFDATARGNDVWVRYVGDGDDS